MLVELAKHTDSHKNLKELWINKVTISEVLAIKSVRLHRTDDEV